MKCFFIGGTKRGYLTLKALVESGAEVMGVISLRQDEHETERFETAIQQLSEEFHISHYETKWLKDADYAKLIRDSGADMALVVGCRVLIAKEVYEAAPLGTLAVHDSMLPEYRGFAPLNWAILNGEDHTGVTLFFLNELMDGGDIVAQREVPISPTDTAPEVYSRVCDATVEIVLEAYPALAAGSIRRVQQDYSVGSFTCSRTPADGLIDWHRSSREIFDQIRALTSPYPGAFTYYQSRKLTIWSASLEKNPPLYRGRIPGRVVAVSKAQGHADVLTGDGMIRILQVQAEGENRTSAANVIHSVRDFLGLRLEELLQRIRLLEAGGTTTDPSRATSAEPPKKIGS